MRTTRPSGRSKAALLLWRVTDLVLIRSALITAVCACVLALALAANPSSAAAGTSSRSVSASLGLSTSTASLTVLSLDQSAAAVQTGIITPGFPNGDPVAPKITATAAILINMDTGQIIYSRAANKRLPMASTTKIMTGILALEHLTLTDRVTISARVASTIGSSLGYQQGETPSVEQLLYDLLVPSANDAAVALAEATAGSVPAFVELMNEKAEDLGLTNTHYSNPNGLDTPRHFSSAKDLATLAAYAMKNPVFRRIVATPGYELMRPGPDGKPAIRKLENHNGLVAKYSWITGVKTGQTPDAKFCLVASGAKDGLSLVSVVLGAADDQTRMRECAALLRYGFALSPRTTLVGAGRVPVELEPADVLHRRIQLIAEKGLIARVAKGSKVVASVILDSGIALPVQAGDVLGEMDFTLNGDSLGSVKLRAAQTIERATIRSLLAYWQEILPPKLSVADRLAAMTSG